MKIFPLIGYVLKAIAAGLIAGGATYSQNGDVIASIAAGFVGVALVFAIPNGAKPA